MLVTITKFPCQGPVNHIKTLAMLSRCVKQFSHTILVCMGRIGLNFSSVLMEYFQVTMVVTDRGGELVCKDGGGEEWFYLYIVHVNIKHFHAILTPSLIGHVIVGGNAQHRWKYEIGDIIGEYQNTLA